MRVRKGGGNVPVRTIVIWNPDSGASMMAERQSPVVSEQTLLETLRTYDIEAEIRYITEQTSGRTLAQQAAQEGVEMIIAVGGDGTIHAIGAGLIGTRSTLGIIPLGTMNNIARSLSIPERMEEACRIIAEGETRKIDVGQVNEDIFLEVVGIGFEAALFPAAEEIKRYGWLSTIQGVIDGLITLFSFEPSTFFISFDGRRALRYRAIQVSICNSPYYGARLQFAPDAVMDDGLLDILIYKNFSKLEYLRHAISISQGRRSLLPSLVYRKVRSARIRTALPAQVHLDGRDFGTTPVDIKVLPEALRVRLPLQTATGSHSGDKHETLARG